jgi:hypothetical protein
MTTAEKYDKLYLGAITGFVIPIIISLIVWQCSSRHNNLTGYIQRIVDADIVTHIISLCVFPNIFLFLMFNRLDMLRATRGVLGITIFWAVLVFAVKFLL